MSQSERLIDEIRRKLRIKNEELKNDPNASDKEKYRFSLFYDFFRDVEAVAKSPKSTVESIMIELGYDFSDIVDNRLYEKLCDEVNRKFVLVDPSYVRDYDKKIR